MKAKFFLLIAATVLVTSCDDDDGSAPVPTSGDLFPLAVGNTWEYRYRTPHGLDDFDGVKKEITAEVQLEGRTYYQMITTWKSMPKPYLDTLYYRMDNNGFVYQRRKAGEEGNPFRINASDKSAWRYSASSTEEDMHVINQEPITIRNTPISNARLFTFDVAIMADEEWYTTLAPGIGIVTMSTAWVPPMDLQSAVINGKSYDF